MTANRQKHDFDSDGVPIAFLDEGAGPPVLLIHGFASNAVTNWVAPGMFDALVESGRRVVALDNRGHGDSGKPAKPAAYGLRRMAGDALRLLDHLGIATAAVMGYSMGARIATHLALDHPSRVTALLLGGVGETLISGRMKAPAIVAGLEAADPASVTDPIAQQFRTFADRLGSDRQALAACMRAIADDGIAAERLADLTMPVQIVIGEEDAIAGARQPLAAAMPQAELVVVPRRDHMKTVGDRLYRAAVLAFLDRAAPV